MPTQFVDVLGRTLDARPDRLDLRDREFTPQLGSLPQRWPDDAELGVVLPAYVAAGLVLDQGREGACTGFGLACVVNYLLFRQVTGVAPVSARMLFHLARFYDEWPGEDYEGSSCRGALKAWHKHGVCRESLWPYRDARGRERFIAPRDGWDLDALTRTLGVYYRIDHQSVVDLQAAILQVGAVYVSCDVHDGWRPPRVASRAISHESLPRIAALRSPQSLGGHAFALVGFNVQGFIVQNSWGTRWGQSGFALLPYAEWVQHGNDAWVCTLGVPGDPQRRAASHVAVLARPRAQSVPAAGAAVRELAAVPPRLKEAVRPWSPDRALFHTLVLGQGGRVINRLVAQPDAAACIREVVRRLPAAWGGARSGPKRLMIYAHGGLNSEAESIERIRILAPYFLANGIYPLFVTWRTGPVETLRGILDEQLQRVPRPAGLVWERLKEVAVEALDRTIESVAAPVARPIWTQMKVNAAAAAQRGMGLDALARSLAALQASGSGWQIHLVGHSAGAILLGHLLTCLRRVRLRVRTCSLYAPACSIDFALAHYATAFAARTLARRDLHLHVLSDQRELDDTVGPYRKSLLYLVSRALEPEHKTPLLGLERDCRRLWTPVSQVSGLSANLHVLSRAQVSTGRLGKPIRTTHACFDNAAEVIDATLRRILQRAPRYPVQWLDY
jgi:hypothetical protein